MAGRTRGYPGWQLLLLLLVLGGIIGGWIGEALLRIWPALSWLAHTQSVGLPTMTVDLHVFSLSFGFMLNINFFSILGFILAGVLYRRIN